MLRAEHSNKHALYLDIQTAKLQPHLAGVSVVPQDTGQRSVNSTIQKGKWDGMCYSYALSVTKHSTTIFSYLFVQLENIFEIYLPQIL